MEQSELKNVLAGEPTGWFLFIGEENYLKRYYCEQFRQKICPDEAFAAFNHAVFDGPEPDVPKLREAVIAAPVMAERKLVEWRYADFENMKEPVRRALDELLAEREKYPYTVLIFTAEPDGFDPSGLPKRPGKLFKAYEKKISIVNFPKSSDAALLSWLKKHFASQGVSAEAPALRALLERVGHSMDVLIGEVDKLCAFVKANGRGEVTAEDVAAVCCANTESDAFALTDAIGNGDKNAAFRYLRNARNERTDPAILMGMMIRAYCDLSDVCALADEGMNAEDIAKTLNLNPFRAKILVKNAKALGAAKISACLGALIETDVASKSGGVGGWTAAELFVAEYL